jgi:hypothetical protein
MRITSSKTIANTMRIPCKALLLLHIYIINDNNDCTVCTKSNQSPSTKLKINRSEKNNDGILTYFQTKIREKVLYKHINSKVLLAKKASSGFFLVNLAEVV